MGIRRKIVFGGHRVDVVTVSVVGSQLQLMHRHVILDGRVRGSEGGSVSKESCCSVTDKSYLIRRDCLLARKDD